ncbi:MAG: Clp protease ClpP [Oscillospiraceae bacterium]|jgi:ATP-dependent Clp protease protease subunit|nr:Clp protease ClpP [Oscillospiraceae bacterium]
MSKINNNLPLCGRTLQPHSGCKFWNFSESKNDGKERILRIDGIIAEESFLDDDVTPKQFKSELESGTGDITVWINSCGGDVFSASQIYNMLRGYKGKVIVKIDGIAASAASLIAMSGDEILMSPVSLMMIHNPSTLAFGEKTDMQKAISMLDETKEAIINAYQERTKLSRKKIADLMSEETWLNARKAVELGFADKIMYDYENIWEDKASDMIFCRAAFANKVLEKLKTEEELKRKEEKWDEDEKEKEQKSKDSQIKSSIEPLYKRLNLLSR